MTVPAPAIILSAAIAVLTACEPSSTAPAPATIVDSAGVRITHHHQLAAEASCSSDPAGALRIGTVDGPPEYRFDGIAAALELDSMIVVADAGSGEVRLYGPDARHLRSFGGLGSGPGEFRRLSWLGAGIEGELVAWDMMLHRLSRFDPDVGFVGSVTVDLGLPDQVQPVGVFSDGDVLLAVSASTMDLRGRAPGVLRDTVTLYRVSPEDGASTPIHNLPGREKYFAEIDRTWATVPVFFGRRPVAAVRGANVLIGDTDLFAIEEYRGDRLISIIRMDQDPVNVLAAEIRAEKDRLIERLGSVTGSPRWVMDAHIQRVRQTPGRETRPAFANMLVGADGDLWVQDGADSPTWRVFGDDGRFSMRVELPAGFELLHVASGRVIGKETDDMDVERVVVYLHCNR